MGCHFRKVICDLFADREMAKEFFWDIIGDKAAICNLVNYYSAGKGLYFICEGDSQHCPLKDSYVSRILDEHWRKKDASRPAAGQAGA